MVLDTLVSRTFSQSSGYSSESRQLRSSSDLEASSKEKRFRMRGGGGCAGSSGTYLVSTGGVVECLLFSIDEQYWRLLVKGMVLLEYRGPTSAG